MSCAKQYNYPERKNPKGMKAIMKVGTVKEIKRYEYRVGLTPSNVKEYVQNGHEVFVQAGAGMGSMLTDGDYIAAGAKILGDAKEIWDTCDMIVKVKEPLADEYELMREDQIIYTYLHLAADRPLTENSLPNERIIVRCL